MSAMPLGTVVPCTVDWILLSFASYMRCGVGSKHHKWFLALCCCVSAHCTVKQRYSFWLQMSTVYLFSVTAWGHMMRVVCWGLQTVTTHLSSQHHKHLILHPKYVGSTKRKNKNLGNISKNYLELSVCCEVYPVCTNLCLIPYKQQINK